MCTCFPMRAMVTSDRSEGAARLHNHEPSFFQHAGSLRRRLPPIRGAKCAATAALIIPRSCCATPRSRPTRKDELDQSTLQLHTMSSYEQVISHPEPSTPARFDSSG